MIAFLIGLAGFLATVGNLTIVGLIIYILLGIVGVPVNWFGLVDNV